MFPGPLVHNITCHAIVTSVSTSESHIQLCHLRRAPFNARYLLKVHIYADRVPKLCKMEEVFRECRIGKAHILPFSGNFRHTSVVEELVHSDIVGPLEPPFRGRFIYVSIFLEYHSRYAMIGCMRYRGRVKDVFLGISKRPNQSGGAITKLHSDN